MSESEKQKREIYQSKKEMQNRIEKKQILSRPSLKISHDEENGCRFKVKMEKFGNTRDLHGQ